MKNITKHSLGREIPSVVLKYDLATEEMGYIFDQKQNLNV